MAMPINEPGSCPDRQGAVRKHWALEKPSRLGFQLRGACGFLFGSDGGRYEGSSDGGGCGQSHCVERVLKNKN